MPVKSSVSRNAKAPLDRDVFVEAALRLASRPHTLTLTYRDLGKEVGVDPTAIYRHFQSKESLMQELLDRLFKLALAKLAAPSPDWSGRLLDFAEATLSTFMEYPAIAIEATSLTTGGTGELDSIEFMLERFSEAGLRGNDLAEQYAVFAAYVLSGAAGLARDHAESADSEIQEWFTGPLLAEPSRHPLAAGIREQILELDHRKVFLTGVDQLIKVAGERAKA